MSAIGWDAVEAAIVAWVKAGSGLATGKVIWAYERGDRPAAPYIQLSLDEVRKPGIDWQVREPNPLVLADDVVEAINGSFMTLTAHAYENGDGPVQFLTTGVLPPGLALGTDYWLIVSEDGNTVAIASSLANAIAGTRIALGGAGTGVHTIVDTPDTVRVGEGLKILTRGHRVATLRMQCFADKRDSLRILHDVVSTESADLDLAGVGLGTVGPVTLVAGARTTLLEPRAAVDLQIHLASELERYADYIERVQLTVEVEEPPLEIEVWVPDPPP